MSSFQKRSRHCRKNKKQLLFLSNGNFKRKQCRIISISSFWCNASCNWLLHRCNTLKWKFSMPRTAYENTANAESLHSVDIRVDCGVGGANSSCGDTIYPINYVRNARPLIAVTNGNKTEKK